MTDHNNEEKIIQGQKIKELFDICSDQPQHQHETLIANSEYSDEIKAQVRKLLNYSSIDLELTDTIIDSIQVNLDVKPIKPGMKVGEYVLQKPIGNGGQGEVWLAHRKDGDFKHNVAIKFLKPVHDQKDLIRFQTERELLATLKHANIAQLLDGGELADSRPYMVLELVEGVPILEYIQNNKLDISQQLHCFLQICDAISYAHSHSVIHRDIKPLNVYVTNEGVVKLLDFGIAKFLDKEDTKTQTLPIMTLAYSSPEQVTGAIISTATDIYTLGLLLYEMLTGQRAQAVHTDVPSELIHEITEHTPILPSQVDASIDFQRIYSNKNLKGDLDNLILMAIRKEPQRRYSTANAMAKDVNNYLENKPLIAVGDSWTYKTKKLISRNPTATVLSLLLIGFMITIPLMLINNQAKIKSQRDLAIASEQKAQEQSTIANKTTDFLVNILESASPLANKGEDISLNDVLDNAERQLALGLEDQPKTKAHLLNKLASIQHHLGDYKTAILHYKKSLLLFEETNDIEGQVFTLGQLAIVSFLASEVEKSKEYENKANILSQQLTSSTEIAWHHSRMATLQYKYGQKKEAANKLTQILHKLKQEKVNDHELLGRINNELSINTEDNSLALKYNNQALYHAELLHGKNHPKYISRLNNKAKTLNRMKQFKQAEETFNQVLVLAEKLYSENHPRYAAVISELAVLYHDLGRFSEARINYQKAAEIFKSVNGVKNFSYVLAINNLAYLLEDMGQYDQAEKLFRETLSLREKYYSDNPMRVANSKGNLARLLAKRGKFNESQQLNKEVIPVYQIKNLNYLGAEITQIANLLGKSPNESTCKDGIIGIKRLIPQVNKLPEKSWKRMYDELWLGQLATLCAENDLAKGLLKAAKQRANNIYAKGPEGKIYLNQLIDIALSTLEKN